MAPKALAELEKKLQDFVAKSPGVSDIAIQKEASRVAKDLSIANFNAKVFLRKFASKVLSKPATRSLHSKEIEEVDDDEEENEDEEESEDDEDIANEEHDEDIADEEEETSNDEENDDDCEQLLSNHIEDDIAPEDPFAILYDYVLEPSYVASFPTGSVKYHEDQNHLGKFVLRSKNEDILPTSQSSRLNKSSIHLKNNLKNNLSSSSEFSDFETDLMSLAGRYRDILYTERSGQNAEEIRRVYCMHALNHVLKTRQRIINHNAKLNKLASAQDFRDQGLTRPKVLMLMPFRDSAYRAVNCLFSLLFGSKSNVNVLNIKRFKEEFGPEEDQAPLNKPDDYNATFQGNVDDSFRLGIAVTKKSLKLYTDFYASDIILCSPVSLRMIIGAAGDRERDYDFLSSIEVLILDQTDVFLMQNWEHIVHIMHHINLQPNESHGVDFSRVRMWTLEGYSKFYRQTLMFASTNSNEISALFAKEANSYAGQILFRNPVTPDKAIIRQIFVKCPQTFLRFESTSLASLPEERFQFFVNTVLPNIKDQLSHVLIYITSYFDFVRLRNYFRSAELDFTQVCEYTKSGKVAQSRSLFFHGSRKMMLFTERFHFYHRYKVKGIQNIVFYQLPTYGNFYGELCNLMHPGYQGKKFTGDESMMTSTALFCKHDLQQLATIVGTQKAVQMLRASSEKTTFKTDQND